MPLLAAGAAQSRVGQFVDAEVDEPGGGAEHGDRHSGRYEPPPRAGDHRLPLLGEVEHRAPADGVDVADAEEVQAGDGEDGGDEGEHQRRGDHRQQVGQHLDEHDPQIALAEQPGAQDEVPVAQGQCLYALGAGAPGPAGQPDDQGDRERAAPAPQIPGEDDDQRQPGQDEEDVGEGAEHRVDRAAVVAADQPDGHGQRGGDDGSDGTDEQRCAGADDELGEDVGAVLGGAQRVVHGRGWRTAPVSSVGDRPMSDCTIHGPAAATRTYPAMIASPTRALRLAGISRRGAVRQVSRAGGVAVSVMRPPGCAGRAGRRRSRR